MKNASPLVLALVASLAPSVLAHGFLRSITIDGQLYKGNTPNNSNFTSPIRLINDVSPVKGAMNRAVNCGQDAKIAAQVVPAHPGSTVAFDWAGGNGGSWPHNIGPMFTYMATCGTTTCDKFDAINAKWFKIDQVGRRSAGSPEWVQRDLFEGKTTSVKLPEHLKPGQYLLRHEILALHLGTAKGGAEFYPSCAQIEVKSNNSTISLAVEPDETVSLPGAYKDTDPGIFDPDVFNTQKEYQFPGPSISNVVSGSIGPPSSSSSGTDKPTSSCSSSLHPRQISRVMVKFKRTGPTEAISV